MIKLDMLPNYSKKEFERIFSENIGKCAPKNKEILEDYLLNRMTFEEIAEKTGLSKDRVYKVVKEYEKKLTGGVGSPDISGALFDLLVTNKSGTESMTFQIHPNDSANIIKKVRSIVAFQSE